MEAAEVHCWPLKNYSDRSSRKDSSNELQMQFKELQLVIVGWGLKPVVSQVDGKVLLHI